MGSRRQARRKRSFTAKDDSAFRWRGPRLRLRTHDTEVRILFGAKTVYVGILARDTEPDRIVAWILERDRLLLAREGRYQLTEPAPAAKRRCSPSWARLISKVYHADPLVCRQCGGEAEGHRLCHRRDLGQAYQRKKPPPIREVVRVPMDDDGRKIQAG